MKTQWPNPGFYSNPVTLDKNEPGKHACQHRERCVNVFDLLRIMPVSSSSYSIGSACYTGLSGHGELTALLSCHDACDLKGPGRFWRFGSLTHFFVSRPVFMALRLLVSHEASVIMASMTRGDVEAHSPQHHLKGPQPPKEARPLISSICVSEFLLVLGSVVTVFRSSQVDLAGPSRVQDALPALWDAAR